MQRKLTAKAVKAARFEGRAYKIFNTASRFLVVASDRPDRRQRFCQFVVSVLRGPVQSWDNSAMERFFSSLETKRTTRKVYTDTRPSAGSSIEIKPQARIGHLLLSNSRFSEGENRFTNSSPSLPCGLWYNTCYRVIGRLSRSVADSNPVFLIQQVTG